MSRAVREGTEDPPETLRSIVPSPRFSGIGSSAEPHRLKVFLSHRKDDRALAEQLAEALTRYGIEVWFDGWEITDGDNFVFKMQDGLERTNGSLILLTKPGLGGSWIAETQASSILSAAEATPHRSRRFLISVLAGEDLEPPAFLHTRMAHSVDDVEGIVRSILRHSGIDTGESPQLGALWSPSRPLKIELRLGRKGDDVYVTASIGGEPLAGKLRLSPYEIQNLRRKINTLGHARESNAMAIRTRLTEVGRRLGAIFDGSLGTKLTDAITTQQALGETLLRFRSEHDELLALPWETTVWGPTGALGLLRQVTLSREIETQKAIQLRAIPGPLRILFALGAQQQEPKQPRELEFLREVAEIAAMARPRVVFLHEARGAVDRIQQQLQAEAFHVLHLAVRGSPGGIEFEGAAGQSMQLSAEELAQVLTEAKHPPQLVVLGACASGAPWDGRDVDRLHTARVLVEAGIPQVIAMQGPVGDGYATELASHLYRELAFNSLPCAATALSTARRAVERDRVAHATRNEPFRAPVPEFATPVLYAAADCSLAPLFDGTKPIATLQ